MKRSVLDANDGPLCYFYWKVKADWNSVGGSRDHSLGEIGYGALLCEVSMDVYMLTI